MARIAIHGFGRIGRSSMKAALRNNLFTPVSISDITDLQTLAALFAVDSNYGLWHEEVTTFGSSLAIGGRTIPYTDSMRALPDWKALGVDVVIDCTGRATTRPGAQAHLDGGAGRVLISAPSKTATDCDAVLLPGINLEQFDRGKHKIVSMASCTTNALAPVVKVVLEHWGIKYGLFSTIHAYTNSQSLTDQPMKDRRDSWAAAENIIPASSGAARALQFIWKDLKITGKAYRVPIRTGSIAELNLLTERPVTVNEVNAAFRTAAATAPLNGVLGVLEDGWASSRIVGDPHSSIVDLPLRRCRRARCCPSLPGMTTKWAMRPAWPRRRRGSRGKERGAAATATPGAKNRSSDLASPKRPPAPPRRAATEPSLTRTAWLSATVVEPCSRRRSPAGLRWARKSSRAALRGHSAWSHSPRTQRRIRTEQPFSLRPERSRALGGGVRERSVEKYPRWALPWRGPGSLPVG
jgi:glyceraldehyde 3-phosphate dehydrogenase